MNWELKFFLNLIFQFQLNEEKNDRELKAELERAEQRTVHYEEIRVRIALVENQLATILARGEKVSLQKSFLFFKED